MSRDYNLFLGDIRQSCQRILRYTSGLTKDDFVADEKTCDAVLRQLIIVGEAVKNLPQDVRDLYPGVESLPGVIPRSLLRYRLPAMQRLAYQLIPRSSAAVGGFIGGK